MSLGHFWSVILRFCRLGDRIQCAYIDKFINEKYNSIAPSVNDLLAEIDFIFGDDTVKLKKPERSDKPYRNTYIDLDPLRLIIGEQPDNKTGFMDFCVWDLSDNELMGTEIERNKKDWLPIYYREMEEDSFYYVVNTSPESKYYNKVSLYYPNDDERNFVCSISSFLNNFPILFKNYSEKLFARNVYENWNEHLSEYDVPPLIST